MFSINLKNALLAEWICRSGQRRKTLFAALVGLMVLSPAFPVTHAQAEEYLLGPQDELRLKVYEWRASRDVFFEWDALNDSFRIGPDGALSLPFAGTVEAQGLTVEQLANKIGDTLRSRMRLGRSPDVSAEVVNFRPVYVVGDVAKPGEFPFRPGLTALQAVTIAGGLSRATDSRVTRDVIEGRGQLARQHVSRLGMLARRARLDAEANGARDITFPPELSERTGDPSVAVLMKQERDIFKARLTGLAAQTRALEELRDFLTEAIKSLEAHLEFQDKQVQLSMEALANTKSLAEKGFASEARKMEVEAGFVRAQSDRLTAETSLLRARQEKSQTEISILELQNRHENDVRTALRETQAQLDELDTTSATTVQLLNEAEVAAAEAPSPGGTPIDPVYTIVRVVDGKPSRIAITETDEIRPGDTLKVDIPVHFSTPATQTEAGSERPETKLGMNSDRETRTDIQ